MWSESGAGAVRRGLSNVVMWPCNHIWGDCEVPKPSENLSQAVLGNGDWRKGISKQSLSECACTDDEGVPTLSVCLHWFSCVKETKKEFPLGNHGVEQWRGSLIEAREWADKAEDTHLCVSTCESPGISSSLLFTWFIAISPPIQKPLALMKRVESSCEILPTRAFSPKIDKGNVGKKTMKISVNEELQQKQFAQCRPYKEISPKNFLWLLRFFPSSISAGNAGR